MRKEKILKEYQKAGVNFLTGKNLYDVSVEYSGMLERNTGLVSGRRRLLYDECGLGKTVQVLDSCNRWKGSKLLVICPKGLASNWEREKCIWGESIGRMDILYHTFLSDTSKVKRYLDISVGSKTDYDIIVVDECHNFKDWRSKRTRNLVQVINTWKNAYLWMLSATPFPNGANEAHVLYSLMEPGRWGKYVEFCEKYCVRRYREHGQFREFKKNGTEVKFDYVGLKKGMEGDLKEALKRFGLRREKKEVEKELLPVEYIEWRVETGGERLGGNVEAIGKKLSEGRVLNEGEEKEYIRLLKLKLKYSADFLLNLEPPCLIFFYHRVSAEILRELLTGAGFRVGIIIGGADNGLEATKFANGEYDFLLVSIVCGREGFNLQRASRGVFFEYYWVPGDYEQAVGRMHRIGQKGTVFIYNLVLDGGVDEIQLKVMEEKRRGINLITKG